LCSRAVTALAFLALVPCPAAAQAGADDIAAASRAYANREYSRCAELLGAAIDKGRQDQETLYNAACCHALAGHKDRAFALLERGIEAGYKDPLHLGGDPDLASLREDPRWRTIEQRVAEAWTAHKQSLAGRTREFLEELPSRDYEDSRKLSSDLQDLLLDGDIPLAKAEALLREELQKAEQTYGVESAQSGWMHDILWRVVKRRVTGGADPWSDDPDKVEELRALGRRSLEVKEKALGPEHPAVADSLRILSGTHKHSHDIPGALLYQERAAAIREKALGPDHLLLAESLMSLGKLRWLLSDYQEAKALQERSAIIHEKVLGPDHPDSAEALKLLGIALHTVGEFSKAREVRERVVQIQEKIHGPDSPELAYSLRFLMYSMSVMGHSEDARLTAERALAISEPRTWAADPDAVFGPGRGGR